MGIGRCNTLFLPNADKHIAHKYNKQTAKILKFQKIHFTAVNHIFD